MDAVRREAAGAREFRGQELDAGFLARANRYQSLRSEREQDQIGAHCAWSRLFAASLRFLSKLFTIDLLRDSQCERPSLRTLFGPFEYYRGANDRYRYRTQQQQQLGSSIYDTKSRLPKSASFTILQDDVNSEAEPEEEQEEEFTRRRIYWPLAVRWLLTLVTLRLLVRTYLLYSYEFHLLKYKHHSRLSTSPSNATTSRADILHELQLIERRLGSIGANTYESSFFVEILNIYVALTIVTTHFVAPCVFRFMLRIYFPLGKRILHLKLERRAFVRLAALEANSFIVSLKSYNRLAAGKLKALLLAAAGPGLVGGWSTAPPGHHHDHRQRGAAELGASLLLIESEMLRLRSGQQFLVGQLKEFVFTGALETAGWRPGWINGLSAHFCLFVLSAMVANAALAYYVLVHMDVLRDGGGPTTREIRQRLAAGPTPAGPWLDRLESSLGLAAGVLGLTYYAGTILLSLLDLLLHVRELLQLVRRCSTTNRLLIDQLAPEELEAHGVAAAAAARARSKSTGNFQLANANLFQAQQQQHQRHQRQFRPSEQWPRQQRHHRLSTLTSGRQLNSNLLHAYLHYKVYLAGYRRLRRLLPTYLGFGFVLIFSLPTLTVLHEPYLAAEAKRLYTMLCLVNIFFMNSILVPICYVRARSADLYRALCSLAAHTIWTHELRPLAALYEPHLIWSLRKELADAAKMIEQFEARFLGVTINYANLLRFHIWFGLLVLSMLNGLLTRGGDEVFARYFNDPLGLMRL